MFEGTTCNAGKLCLSEFLVEINLKIFSSIQELLFHSLQWHVDSRKGPSRYVNRR